MEETFRQITYVTAPTCAVDIDCNVDDLWVYCTALRTANCKSEDLNDLLTATERSRAERLANHHLQQEYVVCHATLRQLLGYFLDCDPVAVPIGCGAYDKPFVDRKARHGDLHFNLAHSHGYALFVLAWNTEVGIDLEWINPENVSETTAMQFLTPAEMKRLQHLPEAEKINEFYSSWTRKEAYTKALGKGLSESPTGFELMIDPERPDNFVPYHPEKAQKAGWYVIDISEALPVHAFKAALAIGRITPS